MRLRHGHLLVMLGLGLVAMGCGSKPEPVTTATPDSRPDTPTTGEGPSTPPPPSDPGADERARADALQRLRATLAETVFFDYDQSELRPEGRAALDRKLAILEHSPTVRIRISGHADERGSDEYNLALGMRRATAAQRYLTQRGVAANRIEVVSLGEERPLESGHDETAWSRNRRAEFEMTAGTLEP